MDDDEYEIAISDAVNSSEEINFNDESPDDSSSEEEVLPVCSESQSDSDDDYGDIEEDVNLSESDINDKDDDLPDPKAWGKRNKFYYNGDNINDKTCNILNEEDEEAAKMEEEEALAIQKRLISKIDDADVVFDLLSDVMIQKEERDAETFFYQNEKVEVDLSQISESGKMELLRKQSPELLTYIEDYKVLMICVRDELIPVIKKLKKNKLEQSGASQFIKLYCRLIMNYCTNIIFYVLLKSRKMDTKSHPCSKWLNQYKGLVDESILIYDEVFKPQIKLIMQDNFKLLSLVNRNTRKLHNEAKNRVLKPKTESAVENSSTNHDAENNDTNMSEDISCAEENYPDMENDLDDEKGSETNSKRPITYQIAKNKGLTPHRKKELRNPRVKHRMKYRKAKIRRKGQVREVRKEICKYGGEISGIKANVIKSIKFKA